MTKTTRRPVVQRPHMSSKDLMKIMVKDVATLAMNEKGKLKYIDELDAVMKEIYGVKKIGTKLLTGKVEGVKKVARKIDIQTIVSIMSSREYKYSLRAAVLLCHKAEYDIQLTTKESEKIRKTIKKLCKMIRTKFDITRLKNEDDISLSDLKNFIEDKEDEFDEYDDIFDFGSEKSQSKTDKLQMTNTERFLAKYGMNRATDEDDDDDDEIDGIWNSLGELDDEEEEDDNDATPQILTAVVDSLNKINDRMTALEKTNRNPVVRTPIIQEVAQQYSAPYPIPQEPRQPVQQSQARPDDALNAINKLASLMQVNTANVAKLSGAIGKIDEKLGDVSDVVAQMYDDLYENPDESITATSMPITGNEVPMEDIYAQMSEAPEEDNGPVRIKNLGN